jgi:hypothetical protein
VAEWQTRTVQVRVSERTWGFNSPLAHLKTDRTPSRNREGVLSLMGRIGFLDPTGDVCHSFGGQHVGYGELADLGVCPSIECVTRSSAKSWTQSSRVRRTPVALLPGTGGAGEAIGFGERIPGTFSHRASSVSDSRRVRHSSGPRNDGVVVGRRFRRSQTRQERDRHAGGRSGAVNGRRTVPPADERRFPPTPDAPTVSRSFTASIRLNVTQTAAP